MRSGRSMTSTRSGMPSLLLILTIGGAGCSHTRPPAAFDLSRGPLVLDDFDPSEDDEGAKIQESETYLASLKRDIASIEKVTKASAPDTGLVAPVLSVMRAEVAEVSGDSAAGADAWRAALRTSPGQGKVARMIFDHWVRHLTRHLKPGTNAVQVARDALASVGGGRDSQYLLAQGLLTDTDLARRLVQIVPDRVTMGPQTMASGTDDVMPPAGPPTTGRGNPDDPLLTGTIRQACAAKLPNQIAAWANWAKGLTGPWRGYWDGAIADCTGHHGNAVTAFEGALALMDAALERKNNEEETDETQASLRLEMTGRLIKARRALGERETLNDAYTNLMAAWRARDISAKSMGLNPASFALRRIDDTMWAARQRALSDDLEGAESLAREALDLVNRAFPDPAFIAASYRRDLASLRCEVLHFLSFRVAFERREWTQAALLTEDALATVPITPEWQRRLQSHAILYDFSAGQMALARRRLEQMLGDAQEDSTRAFSLFWLARVHEQMGQKTESDFYLKSLIEEQPLSYYAVVAAPATGLLPSDAWMRNFGDLEKLRGKLRSISLPDSADLGSGNSVWRSSRQLAEIMISARVAGPWARAAVADAADAAFKLSRPDRNPDAFLYLSRLSYSAGDYGRAIELTTSLSSLVDGFWNKYPEQIFIIYPFPRLKTFNGVGGTTERVTLMLGLARQESSFRAEARSAARAFGYMQLTAATARRIMGQQSPASDDIIESMLLDPQTSIRLSARYIDLLEQRFSGSEMLMAAAYNAGEFAVLGWRKRREVEDQPLFIETIPYGETKGYVKAVLRNATVYRRLLPLTRESLAGNKKDP